jgi:carbon storage regulator
MLVLSRKKNESLIIGDNIEILVLDVKDGNVKIGIKAPKDVSIYRHEVYNEIKKSELYNNQNNLFTSNKI